MLSFLKRVFKFFSRLLQAVFYPDKEKDFPWLTPLWIGLLILAGLFLWGHFFNWGDINFNYMDWGEVWAARMQAWHVALEKNTIPLHLNDLGAMRTENDRYFTVGDMVSSPQVILLRWLEVGLYTLVNNWILYGVAAFFLIQIRKKFKLSLFAFAFMFLLFQFNGFIVTHLAVGHLSWGGYYLFPAFVLFLLEVLEGDRSWKWVSKMAFLLFFMFLQGSLHHLVWCFIVMGILAVTRWKSFLPLAKAVLFAVLLSMPRVLPVFFRLNGLMNEMDFLDGFHRLGDILHSMVFNAGPEYGMPGKVYESVLGYWEFDIFTGWVGLGLILVFGIIFYAFWQAKKKTFPWLLLPAFALVFLSIQDNYLKVLFYNPLLASSERVTSRMMGLALAIFIILAAIGYQRFLEALPENLSFNLLFLLPQLALLPVLAYDLVLHTLRWSVKNGIIYLSSAERDLSRIQISNHPDPVYFGLLIGGSLVSLASMAFLFWISRRKPALQANPTGQDTTLK
jgi:hypothetical protein